MLNYCRFILGVFIDYYYEELQEEQYEPLDDENIKTLFAEYKRTGDINIRNILITHNLRLVCNVVKKYKASYKSDSDFIKDIFQAGNVGLMRAVDYFDVEKGYKFSTYACHCIETEIIRLIDNSDIIRITPYKKRKIYSFNKAIEKLCQTLDRNPTLEELSNFLDLSIEELENLYKLMILNGISFDEELGNSDTDIKFELKDVIPDDSPDMVDVVMKKEIAHIVEELIDNSDLTETERKIVEMYYGLNGNGRHTLEEISVIIKDKHKLTRERIRKIRDKALEKMKCCPNSDILLSAKTCIGDEPMFYPVYRRIRK